MAKRTPTRSRANEGAAAAPARPKTRRSRAKTATERAQQHSSSIASEPSDDDIRKRAYQRYLWRGGGHGMDFEDWLEAERELKSSK